MRLKSSEKITDHPFLKYLSGGIDGISRNLSTLNAYLIDKAIKLALLANNAIVAYKIADEVDYLSDLQLDRLVQTIVAAENDLVALVFAEEMDISVGQQYRLVRVVAKYGDTERLLSFGTGVELYPKSQQVIVNTVCAKASAHTAVRLGWELGEDLTQNQVNSLYEKVLEGGSINHFLRLAKGVSGLSDEQVKNLGRLVVDRCTGHEMDTAIGFGIHFRLDDEVLQQLVKKSLRFVHHWHRKKMLKQVRGLTEKQLEKIEEEI